MPSVTTITSYKPVGPKTTQKPTQRAKLKVISLDMPKLREMVKEQKLESFQPMGRTVQTVTMTMSDYYGCGEDHPCENCRGSF